jgi:NitT/TauT family transport system substrate-binding protein
MRRRFIYQALFATTVGGYAYLSTGSVVRAGEALRVGVSIPAAVAFLPLQVGIEIGIFKKHGLDVERSDLGGAAKAQQALAAASIDIAVGGGPELSIVAKGRHALAVAVITPAPRQTTLIVRNDSQMTSPGELRGKTVGISTAGGLSHWVVRQLGRKLGWGSEGIKFAALGSDAAQVAGLRTGQIDATVMDFGAGLRLEQLGTGRIFLKVRDFIPKLLTQAVYANKDILAKRPDAVRSFLAGWYETVAYMRANKDTTVAISARQMDVSPEMASRVYDELIDNYSTDGRFEPEPLEVLVNSLIEMGSLADSDIRSLYTEAYLPKK